MCSNSVKNITYCPKLLFAFGVQGAFKPKQFLAFLWCRVVREHFNRFFFSK